MHAAAAGTVTACTCACAPCKTTKPAFRMTPHRMVLVAVVCSHSLIRQSSSQSRLSKTGPHLEPCVSSWCCCCCMHGVTSVSLTQPSHMHVWIHPSASTDTSSHTSSATEDASKLTASPAVNLFPSCSLGRLAQTLSTSAQTTNLASIIIHGPDADPAHMHHHTDRLVSLLDPLQHLRSLQHLVLLLPTAPNHPYDMVPALAPALGQLTQLRSLCVKVSVPLGGRPKQYTRRLASWGAGGWSAAIQPLSQLTSLQLQLPLRLNYEDELQLQSLSNLQRLELHLDKDRALQSDNQAHVVRQECTHRPLGPN
jgi:hypothetical protein